MEIPGFYQDYPSRLPPINSPPNVSAEDSRTDSKEHSESAQDRRNTAQVNDVEGIVDQSRRSSRFQRSVSYQGVMKPAVSLFQVRQIRNHIKQEQQALLARIQKLQTEELQIEKKIDQTTKKAYEIYSNKKQIVEKKEEKMRKKLEEVDKVPFTHPKAQLDQLRVQLAKEDLARARKQAVQFMKDKYQAGLEQKAREEQARVESVRWRVGIVQQQKKRSQLRTEINKELKYAQLRKNIDQRRQEEIDQIEGDRDKIELLERLEGELLDRVKNTAMRQKIAQEQYEYSRKNDPTEFERRFGIDRGTIQSARVHSTMVTMPTQTRERHPTQNKKYSEYEF